MAKTTETPSDFAMPPASFTFLIESIMMQTQIQLGIFPMETGEEEAEPNLAIARHSIDLLAVLQEKTRGNLSTEEQRLLENGLTELRFRFVQVSDELAKKDRAEPTSEAAGKPLIITADGGKGTKTE